jgi:hypothetical protein
MAKTLAEVTCTQPDPGAGGRWSGGVQVVLATLQE